MGKNRKINVSARCGEYVFVSLTICRLPSISAPDLFCCLFSLSLNHPICLNPTVHMCPIHVVYNSLAVINQCLASYVSHPNCSFSWTLAYTLKDSKARNIMETLREKMTELEIMSKTQRNKKRVKISEVSLWPQREVLTKLYFWIIPTDTQLPSVPVVQDQNYRKGAK